MIWLTVSWRACQTDDDNSTRRRREEKRARRDRARASPSRITYPCNLSSFLHVVSIDGCSTYLVSQDIIFGFRSDCASWLFVQSYCKEPSLPPSLAICVIYVLTTFFRSLARSSERTLLRSSLAPSSREVLITVASGMRTSWRRPSLPLRSHTSPSRAPPCAPLPLFSGRPIDLSIPHGFTDGIG